MISNVEIHKPGPSSRVIFTMDADGSKWEATTFRGGKNEIYRFQDGIPMFLGYSTDLCLPRAQEDAIALAIAKREGRA